VLNSFLLDDDPVAFLAVRVQHNQLSVLLDILDELSVSSLSTLMATSEHMFHGDGEPKMEIPVKIWLNVFPNWKGIDPKAIPVFSLHPAVP
jgi:hypothetical protein